MFKKSLIASVLAIATMGAFAQAPLTPATSDVMSPVKSATAAKHETKGSKHAAETTKHHKTKVSHTKAKTPKAVTQPVS